MTASRKSIIILFFALIAGFIAGSVILLLLYQALLNFFSGEAFSIISTFTGLTWLFCYPLFAISYLFFRQVGNPFSRWGMIISLIIGLCLIIAMVFEFQAHLLENKQVGLIYLIVPLPIVVFLSCLVIGIACINEKQKKLTQIFGYSALICTILLCLFILLRLALSYTINLNDESLPFSFGEKIMLGFVGIGFGLFSWLESLSVLFALLSPVFHGLKDDEQSAYSTSNQTIAG